MIMKRTTLKKKFETRTDLESIINRLNRIEGQVRGVKGMIEKESPCNDVLNQVASIQSALNSFKKILFERHLRTCVKHSDDSDQKLDELVETINFIF